MSFQIRLCRNDTTTYLRDTFKATPLLVPEARVKPLMVVARRNADIQFRGELRFLLDDPDWAFGLRDEAVSSASLDKTRKVDAGLGLQILRGFLKGLNAGHAPVEASLSGVKTLSLSFHNVRRHFADLNELGLALAGRRLNLNHPSLGLFRGDDPYQMLLVSDAIVSSEFSINKESGGEGSLEAGVPALHDYLAKAQTNLRRVSNTKSSITFEGDQPLTFAFSCVRLETDPATGALQILEAVTLRGDGPQESQPRILLDNDLNEPGLLVFDDEPATTEKSDK
ncbi:hypothetical protein DYU11_29540 [Fibrisoma montanum]|uniref:Gasdermin bGSDM n=1 Tax=Fibrisoma montanum TaxID=2305895 RepID=A0A418LXU6_9BACT|nr:hypothetical protein [Fibrisoma montanum]RIV18101.1 hypothetical protein DYU11_29540 [Fibrisoma montanum]